MNDGLCCNGDLNFYSAIVSIWTESEDLWITLHDLYLIVSFSSVNNEIIITFVTFEFKILFDPSILIF